MKDNLVGQRFGRLFVVEDSNIRQGRKVLWRCVCDCGNERLVLGNNLKTGKQKSCGCYRNDFGEQRIKDISGGRFGKLTVIKQSEKRSNGKVNWVCLCDCGKTTIVSSSDLTTGNTKSCGCLKQTPPNKTHGQTGTRLYRIWRHMIERCNRQNAAGFERYGGRGIDVCNEWESNFEPFRDWAVANGYDDTLTIDRIDSNGNYEPSNCRWADKKLQAQNRGTSIIHDGKCLKELAEEAGIPYKTVHYRIKHGWSLDRALHEPLHFVK